MLNSISQHHGGVLLLDPNFEPERDLRVLIPKNRRADHYLFGTHGWAFLSGSDLGALAQLDFSQYGFSTSQSTELASYLLSAGAVVFILENDVLTVYAESLPLRFNGAQLRFITRFFDLAKVEEVYWAKDPNLPAAEVALKRVFLKAEPAPKRGQPRWKKNPEDEVFAKEVEKKDTERLAWAKEVERRGILRRQAEENFSDEWASLAAELDKAPNHVPGGLVSRLMALASVAGLDVSDLISALRRGDQPFKVRQRHQQREDRVSRAVDLLLEHDCEDGDNDKEENKNSVEFNAVVQELIAQRRNGQLNGMAIKSLRHRIERLSKILGVPFNELFAEIGDASEDELAVARAEEGDDGA